jgi:hypothetical protein
MRNNGPAMHLGGRFFGALRQATAAPMWLLGRFHRRLFAFHMRGFK